MDVLNSGGILFRAQNPVMLRMQQKNTGTPVASGSYYRARYYDPKVGRFISEDPIRFEGGINFHAYVTNSPTILTDPFGLGGTLRPSPQRLRKLAEMFPGSVVNIRDNFIKIPMPCDDVIEILDKTPDYATPNNTPSPWYNPWLFASPFHEGGTEVHGRPDGLHFRVVSLPCGDCELDQFHIDPHNPLDHPVQHLLFDAVPWFIDEYVPPIAPLEPTIPR